MKLELGQNIIDLIRGKVTFSEIMLKNFFAKKYDINTSNSLMSVINSIRSSKLKFIKIIDENILIGNENLKMLVQPEFPWIVGEIFGEEVYKFHNKNFDINKKYTVFDIGANHGYASLYFAQKSWCKDVYAFELIPQNIDFAKKSINLNNEQIKNKIKFYEYGLGNADKNFMAQYLKNRDAISSMNTEFIENYAPEEKENIEMVNCNIKQSSRILKEIIDKNNIENIIFKIDVEGAEYEIMQDLVDNYPEIFNKITCIIGDTHLGYQKFIDILPTGNFKEIRKEPNDNGTCPFELAKVGE